MHVRYYKWLLKRIIKRTFYLKKKRPFLSCDLSMPSTQALEVAKSIRGTERESAIIIHGVMPRSGTNYVASILQQHPLVHAYPNDLYEVPFLKYADEILSIQSRFFSTYPKNSERMGNNDFLPLFGSSLIAYLHSFVPKGLRILIKVPDVSNLVYFFHMFPYENLVLLMRDGRDVVHSTINTWPHKKMFDVCRQWNRNAKTILEFNRLNYTRTNGFLFTRYENVLQDPIDFVKEACLHLKLDPDIYPYENLDRLPVIGSSSLKQQGEVSWKPVTKPQGFNPTGRWRTWSSKDRRLFRKVVGETLIDSGYSYDSE